MPYHIHYTCSRGLDACVSECASVSEGSVLICCAYIVLYAVIVHCNERWQPSRKYSCFVRRFDGHAYVT